jgi:hypothetical protein
MDDTSPGHHPLIAHPISLVLYPPPRPCQGTTCTPLLPPARCTLREDVSGWGVRLACISAGSCPLLSSVRPRPLVCARLRPGGGIKIIKTAASLGRELLYVRSIPGACREEDALECNSRQGRAERTRRREGGRARWAEGNRGWRGREEKNEWHCTHTASSLPWPLALLSSAGGAGGPRARSQHLAASRAAAAPLAADVAQPLSRGLAGACCAPNASFWPSMHATLAFRLPPGCLVWCSSSCACRAGAKIGATTTYRPLPCRLHNGCRHHTGRTMGRRH